MSDAYRGGHIESRRRQTEADFESYYRRLWDVKHIVDIQSERDELSETKTRSVAQLVECADIDTIVDTYSQQIAIQEKVITSTRGQNLAIRAENNVEGIAPEAQRLKNGLTEPTLCPSVIALMSKPAGNTEWVRIIDASRFTHQWDEANIRPTKVLDGGSDYNRKLLFDPADIDSIDATIAHYGADQ